MTDEKINKFVEDCAIGVLIASIGIFAVVLGQRFELVGDEASLGDLLTFGSILAAAWIAQRGWRRADKIAQAERERIAKAECAIFYRRHHNISLFVTTVLANIFLSDRNPIREFSKQAVESSDASLTEHFQIVREAMESALEVFPDMSDAHGHLSRVYQYNDKLGDLMSDAIVKITEVRGQLNRHIGRTEKDSLEFFKEDPSTAIHAYYALLYNLTATPIIIERIRRKVHTSNFSSDIRKEVLINLRLSFQSIYGLEFKASDPVTDSDAFIEIFSKAQDAFGKIGVQAQNHVIDRLSTEQQA